MRGGERRGASVVAVAPPSLITSAGVVPGLLGDSPARPDIAIAGLAVGFGAVWLCRSTAIALALAVVCVVAVGGVGAVVGFGGAADQLARTRLVTQSSDRGHEWSAALDQFTARPVAGQGPGRATFTWRADDGRWMQARFAHNEYLELLATQGLVGLASLGVAGALVLRAWRRRSQISATGSPPDGIRIGAVGALVTFAVHSAFDFLWHVPLLPLVAALLAGYLLAQDDRSGLEEEDRVEAVRRSGAGDATATFRLHHHSAGPQLVEGSTRQ